MAYFTLLSDQKTSYLTGAEGIYFGHKHNISFLDPKRHGIWADVGDKTYLFSAASDIKTVKIKIEI
jgi:hypothetical protein